MNELKCDLCKLNKYCSNCEELIGRFNIGTIFCEKCKAPVVCRDPEIRSHKCVKCMKKRYLTYRISFHYCIWDNINDINQYLEILKENKIIRNVSLCTCLSEKYKYELISSIGLNVKTIHLYKINVGINTIPINIIKNIERFDLTDCYFNDNYIEYLSKNFINIRELNINNFYDNNDNYLISCYLRDLIKIGKLEYFSCSLKMGQECYYNIIYALLDSLSLTSILWGFLCSGIILSRKILSIPLNISAFSTLI